MSATRTPGIHAGPGTWRRSPSPPPPVPWTGPTARPGRTDRDRPTGRRPRSASPGQPVPGIGGWYATWIQRQRTAGGPHHQERQVSRPLQDPARFSCPSRRCAAVRPVDPRRMSGPVENLYDVIVIGAGPLGYTVAARGAVRYRPAAAHRRHRPGHRGPGLRVLAGGRRHLHGPRPRRGWLYALGDVNHHALLTHQGKYQARIAGRRSPPGGQAGR